MLLDRRRKSMQAVDLVELGLAGSLSQERTHRDVARPHMAVERREPLLRLDNDPAPALKVEVEGHIVADWVAGADIDIKAARLPFEELGEVIVLEVLRVGEVHRRG